MSFFNPREADIKKAAEKWCASRSTDTVTAKDLVIELTRTTSWVVKEKVVLFHLKNLYEMRASGDGLRFVVRKDVT